MSWALEVAARTLWQEARGEPHEGQRAVAHVIKNRMNSGRWGPNLATVCLWRGQFSGWYVPRDPNFSAACTLDDNNASLLILRNLMLIVLDEKTDPTMGATHYVNLSIVKPTWIQGATFCGKFGAHSFYKDVK